MSELYENLSIRYKNRAFMIDDYGLKGVILHNESKNRLKEMWIKYKYSKFCFIETIRLKSFKIDCDWKVYKIDIIEFVKYALTRGYDFKLYGQPEWEEIAPKTRTKFIKPKIKR